MPARSGRRPESKEQHFQWLKLSILLVAVLIFLWSWLAPARDYVFMFMALSGTIWIAGAGSLIVGGLYWCEKIPLPTRRPLCTRAARRAGALTGRARRFISPMYTYYGETL